MAAIRKAAAPLQAQCSPDVLGALTAYACKTPAQRQMWLRVAALLAIRATAKLPWDTESPRAAARRAFSTLQDGWTATYVASKNATSVPRNNASETWFSVVAATDAEEARLLPHLLNHYAWIPPSRFVVVLHAPQRSATYREMARHVEAFGVVGHVRWSSRYSGAHKEAVRRFAFARLLQKKEMRFGDWIVHADSDEFIVFDGSFEAVLARAGRADVVGGEWTDRVAEHGNLAPIPSQNLWEAFPLNCAFRRKPKVVAYRLPQLVTDGAHAPLGDAVFAKDRAIVYHFKWHSHVLERLKERIEVKRRPRQFGGRGKQRAAHLVESLHDYLVDHDGICVSCEDMRGVCCRAPCDVDSLRPYEAFLRTDPSKPHYFAFGVLLLLCGCCYVLLRRRRRAA